MSKVTVKAGICNFVAMIDAVKNEDTEMIDVKFRTTCPNFKHLEEEEIEIDALVACYFFTYI